ncbi:hypothetical protein TNCV_1219501 [Trichonephila clavipes]|nr:hypothetical protein TNCV_1219501 [Trichonephila clavipes]
MSEKHRAIFQTGRPGFDARWHQIPSECTRSTSEESCFETPLGSGEDLVPRISEAVAREREIPGTFECARQ